MFRIADGRDSFYQWDLDRQIVVEDASIAEVHFCNRTDDCSLVVEVKDGLANVPNVLLQNSFDIRVFGYDGKATFYDKKFKVIARTRPADYVYTETEVLSVKQLAEELRNDIDERLENIVDEVTANIDIPEVDLTGYATEKYVDDAIANIDIPEAPEIDLTGYATEKYVDDAIANIELPEGGNVDLSDYYTKEETNAAIKNADHINKQESAIMDQLVKDGTTLLIKILTTNEEIKKAYTIKQFEDRIQTEGIFKWAGTDNTYVDPESLINRRISDWYQVGSDGTVTKINSTAASYHLRTNVVYVSNEDAIYEYETEEVFRNALKAIIGTDASDYYTKEEIDTLLADLPTGEYRSFEEVEF